MQANTVGKLYCPELTYLRGTQFGKLLDKHACEAQVKECYRYSTVIAGNPTCVCPEVIQMVGLNIFALDVLAPC